MGVVPGGFPRLPPQSRDPGVAGMSRHPLLLALPLGAGGDLVPNGDFVHVILFASLAPSTALTRA
jgi:uncharacterized membrane protein